MLATPISELAAVNSMLLAIGQSPVNAITPQLHDQNVALDTLQKVVREVCQWGFKFNTDDGYLLNPTVDGMVFIPTGALDVDPSEPRQDLTPRKHPDHSAFALWDGANHTFEIGEPVRVTVKWSFEFEALPEAARSYATAAACRRFQAQTVNDPATDRMLQADEQRAWVALLRSQTAAADINAFRASPELAQKTNRRRVWRSI